MAEPKTAEELRAAVLKRYDSLSKRLQQIGRYVLDEPNQVALETLAVLAKRMSVQPSAIVRFAKTFGFEGASDMQRVLREGLLASAPALAYSERTRQTAQTSDKKNSDAPADIFADIAEADALALRGLAQTINSADINTAVRHLIAAETVYVVGFLRAFPIAAHLSYALQQADKRVTLIDGVAGLALQQARTIGAKDLLIAVALHPYADETAEIAQAATEKGARVLAISDSQVSPLAKTAALTLQVREAEVRKTRSLTAAISLAQALATACAVESAKTTPTPSAGEDTRRPGRRGRMPV